MSPTLYGLLVLVACLAGPPVSPTPPPGHPLGEGQWGGDHISMTVTAGGARLEFDCAHGEIEEPILLDADGRFDSRGVYVREAPGPTRLDGPKGKSARYQGRVEKNSMTVSVVVAGSDEPVGPFTLQRDRLARVMKCQ